MPSANQCTLQGKKRPIIQLFKPEAAYLNATVGIAPKAIIRYSTALKVGISEFKAEEKSLLPFPSK